MSVKNLVKQVLIKKENRRYKKQLLDKRISYKQWLAETARDVTDRAIGLGNFVVFVAAEGKCTADALELIGNFFRENPDALLVYGDEDVRGEEWGCPWYKPDWSPDLFKSWFYFGSLVAMRESFFRQMEEDGMVPDDFIKKAYVVSECSGDRAGISGDNSVLRDGNMGVTVQPIANLEAYVKWLESCVELAGGYGRASKSIGHISEILYSCSGEAEQEKFLSLGGVGATPCKKKKVSVIIPSKDNPEVLGKCVEALVRIAEVTNVSVDVVIVDNGSTPVNREKVQAVLAHISCEGKIQADYRYEPMEFNFSKMCNLGAEAAEGEYLLFLNDDVELCKPEVMEEMVTLAAQEYTGAVGLKLLYPGTEKIQHAGITNLPMGPVHKLQFLNDSECYYYNSNRGNRNVLAVTAACMMVEKRKFAEAGGFSEELRVAFNDVDLCFSLYELGYHNICINGMFAYHHESLSRGSDESAEKLNRLLGEREKLYRRHPALEGVDPYYSRYLNRDGLDTRMIPGYYTFRNHTQHIAGKLQKVALGGYRQDECLLVRVEDFRDRHAVGYGVVLDDNNACYEKLMLLQMVCAGECGEAADGLAETSRTIEGAQEFTYGFMVSGQYRQDLEDNMPDQVNVAMSGYDAAFGEGVVPKGTYRVGMAARNRVTGLKLVNWTNRYVEL